MLGSNDLFSLAASPSTTLDGLLKAVLEQALHLTASDLGGAVYLFDNAAQEQKIAASAIRGELVHESTDLLQSWWKNSARSAIHVEPVSGSARLSCTDSIEHQAPDRCLIAGSRSSLWAPMLDGQRTAGFVHVASSQPARYHEQHLNQLWSLAA